MRKKKQWCRIWIDRLVSEIQQERWHWRHLTKKDMGRESRSQQRRCTITWTQKKPTGTLQQASPCCSSTGSPLYSELHSPPVPSLLICEFLGSVIDECWILVGRMPSPLALGLSLIWTILSWWFAYPNIIQRTTGRNSILGVKHELEPYLSPTTCFLLDIQRWIRPSLPSGETCSLMEEAIKYWRTRQVDGLRTKQ